MPRRQESAYTITYAVLGFLARWGATSGYDLSRRFEQGMGYVWEATHSQIYNELRRLKRNGWAEMETQEQEMRPARNIYRITEAGRQVLADWLQQSAALPRIHDELALKTLMGASASSAGLVHVLNESIDAHEQRLRRLHQEVQAHGDPDEPALWKQHVAVNDLHDPYIAIVTQLGIQFEEMYLRWLRETIKRIEAQNP